MYWSTYSSVLRVQLLFPLFLFLWSPLAAQLPVLEVATGEEKRGEWVQATREHTTQLLQDWINLSASGEDEVQAQYFTESGLLALGGEWAQDRASVAELLRERGDRILWITLGPVTPGSRAISASGRAAFQDDAGVERTETFQLLLERHYGRWMLRMLSFTPQDQAGTSTPEGAIQPNRGSPYVPARTWVRLVVEPFASMGHEFGTAGALSSPGSAPTADASAVAQWRSLGGAIGIERNRALELRGFYWRNQLEGEDAMTSYGGELRLHLFEFWRLRPHLSAGAARTVGPAAPDSAWMPVVGGGLGVRLTSMLDFQLFVRDYLPGAEGYSKQEHWTIRPRQHHWTAGAGLSVSLGRKPRWEDARPSMASQEYFGREWPRVQEVLDAWQSAYTAQRWAQLESTYIPSIELQHVSGTRLWGVADVRRFWMERPQAIDPTFTLVSGNVSGDVAYAEARIRSAGGNGWDTLFTVLQRVERDQWRIHAQVLFPGGER